MRLWCLAALSLTSLSLTAQQTFVVDPVGTTPYKTIRSARWVAKPGDTILVHRGFYNETVTLAGVSLIGVAPKVDDVVIKASGSGLAFGVRNHPAGFTSRISRIVVDGGWSSWPNTVQVDGKGGTVIFDDVEIRGAMSAVAFPGSLVLRRCRILSNPPKVLEVKDVGNLFVHDCDLIPNYRNAWFLAPIVFPTTIVTGSSAEFSHCRLRGTHWGMIAGNFAPGGPALTLDRSTVRITGLSSDTVTGGDGHPTAPLTQAGSAIVATASTVILAGVTVSAGAGPAAPAIVNNGGTVQRLSTMAPVVSVGAGLARGKLASLDVFATPGANSLTWVALEITPVPTPFGTLVINPARPSWALPATVGASGMVSFPLDLRTLPASFVGVQYAIQAVTVDTANNLRLSGPCIGVVAN